MGVMKSPAAEGCGGAVGFDRQFWGELAFNALECPPDENCGFGSLKERTLQVLPYTSPSFHIVTAGFSVSQVSAMRSTIPGAVESLTGQPYSGDITTGSEEVFPRDGWIRIAAMQSNANFCGGASLGAIRGSIDINVPLIAERGECGLLTSVLKHEIGHAMGFFHVRDRSQLMGQRRFSGIRDFSDREKYHAQLAYELGRGTPYSETSTAAMTAGENSRTVPSTTGVVMCRAR